MLPFLKKEVIFFAEKNGNWKAVTLSHYRNECHIGLKTNYAQK